MTGRRDSARSAVLARRRPTGGQERGFSVLEMMIALAILGVITSQMFVVLSTQKRGVVSEVRNLNMQESVRLAMDLIAADTRNAGMMVPRVAAVSSVDGGAGPNGLPDRYCVSDTSYFNVGNANVWERISDRFPGAKGSLTPGLNTTTLALDTLDVDGDPNGILALASPPQTNNGRNDWNPLNLALVGGELPSQPGVIIAREDGRASFCTRVRNAVLGVVGGTLTLADSDAPTLLRVPTDVAAFPVIAVPAVIYEWRAPNALDPNDPNSPAGSAGQLLRNGQVFVNDVEDFQVEFWVDTLAGVYPDGVMKSPEEWPIHVLNFGNTLPTIPLGNPPVKHLERIRQVRISIIGRPDLADEASQQLVRSRRPALANRGAATVSDAFSRRMYTVNVLPRNLIDDETLGTMGIP